MVVPLFGTALVPLWLDPKPRRAAGRFPPNRDGTWPINEEFTRLPPVRRSVCSTGAATRAQDPSMPWRWGGIGRQPGLMAHRRLPRDFAEGTAGASTLFGNHILRSRTGVVRPPAPSSATSILPVRRTFGARHQGPTCRCSFPVDFSSVKALPNPSGHSGHGRTPWAVLWDSIRCRNEAQRAAFTPTPRTTNLRTSRRHRPAAGGLIDPHLRCPVAHRSVRACYLLGVSRRANDPQLLGRCAAALMIRSRA
jgi:hypothetical protein